MIPNTRIAGKEINDRKVGGCMTGGRERERMGRRADDTLQRKMSRQRDRYTGDDDDGWMDVIHGQVDDGRMDGHK